MTAADAPYDAGTGVETGIDTGIDTGVDTGVDTGAAVDPHHAALWRDAVLDLRRREPRRRVFPTTVHVGRPGSVASRFTVPEGSRAADGLDLALRTDVLVALLDRELHGHDGHPWTWVARAGDLGPHDEDAAWLAAARAAYGEASCSAVLVVVTTRGWYDPVRGVGRRWKRLRHRPAR